jgi:hypothetical protein
VKTYGLELGGDDRRGLILNVEMRQRNLVQTASASVARLVQQGAGAVGVERRGDAV